MIKQLRPYQQEVVQTLKERLKIVKHPLLVTASVGAGKSLIIASILRWMEHSNYRALCLTLNSTLIQQNAETYQTQGGHCGIYCASIGTKEIEPLVIFGSPQSVCNAIRDKQEISHNRFNLLVIDEAHNVHPHNMDTMFQRIINHYALLAQTEGYSYRVIGLTGTPYRGKGNTIVGDKQFFKEEVCNISASWLISQGYLTPPIFGLPKGQIYDFSNIRVNSMGKFNNSQLQAVIDSNERLTGQIMRELQEVMKTRTGAFIFCCTRRHCEEALRSLPQDKAAIITGETPHDERKIILANARSGSIMYLISVGCLNVGVDVPSFDVCVWLRPTESLVLYTQGIGRVLRLSEGKATASILDYAGNLDRHGDIDDPIINAALQPTVENEKDFVIPCNECETLNTVHSRRCIGVSSGTRCSHYFEWKECPGCGAQNDVVTRHCRLCGCELIDPNAKLKSTASGADRFRFDVVEAKYWVSNNNDSPNFYAAYKTHKNTLTESYILSSEKSKNYFYGTFVRPHVKNASQYYPHLTSSKMLNKMLESGDVKTPNQIECVYKDGQYKIVKKLFQDILELS